VRKRETKKQREREISQTANSHSKTEWNKEKKSSDRLSQLSTLAYVSLTDEGEKNKDPNCENKPKRPEKKNQKESDLQH